MELDPIALSAVVCAFMAFIAAFTLLYDWYITGKGERPRLEWGVGMIAFGVGELISALMYSVIDVSNFTLFIQINITGAIGMGFMLYGTLILFDSNIYRAKLISITYGCFFTIGTFLFGFVFASSLPIAPVLLGEINNRSMMLWFGVETVIPVSFLVAYLMFVDLRETQNIASFWISLHFFLYGLLLFIWPLNDYTLTFIFHVGYALSTAAILVGVRELGRKKVYSQLIREVKAETAFLFDVVTHDIKGYIHGSKMLLEYGAVDKESQKMILNNLTMIDTLVKRVRRFRSIDRFSESSLTPLDLVEIIKKNLNDVKQSFPKNKIEYKLNLDPNVNEYEILGNDFLNDLFLNILNNAVKHHNSNSNVRFNITIKYMQIEDLWQIAVDDNGPGIPEELVDSLFSISGNGITSSVKGLGHLIIRKIVQWYGGKIWAENRTSNGEIEGATILLLLPKTVSKSVKN